MYRRDDREEGDMTPEELEREFVKLAEKGEYDKILGQLRAKWSDTIPRDVVLEMLQEACGDVIDRQRRGQAITNVAGLLRTITDRRLYALWKSNDIVNDRDDAFEEIDSETGRWRHSEERHEQVARGVAFVKEALVAWPDNNYRRVLHVIIDAAAEGMQLEPKELGELLGVDRGTARVWRERAYARLAAQFEKQGISWEYVTGLVPAVEAQDDEEDDYEKEDA